MEIKKRQNYSKEFKSDAVELMLSGDKNVEDIAAELGVPVPNLHRWKREIVQSTQEGFERAPKSLQPAVLDQENRRLRRELDKVRLERDILKKLCIFSANQESENELYKRTQRGVSCDDDVPSFGSEPSGLAKES